MKSIFEIKKSKLKEEKGSASALALFTVLAFSIILISVYMTIMTKQKSQLKSDMRIQDIYGEDVKNVDMIYEMQKAIRDGSYDVSKDVNSPALLTGMTPIRFTMPDSTQMGVMGTVNLEQDSDWYEYGKTDDTRRWANAQTEDGSMWVWIPRYAYKITYTNASDKSKGGKIDIKFLIGKTDYYYDDEGNIQVAKRCNSEDEIVDTTSDYVVHPAFTDESNINFRNGGWDEELTGIWVAKFEAGYASGNNDAPVKASNVNYTETGSLVTAKENGTSSESYESARNWLDGIYGETITSIKYPTFQGTTYSMNYINHNDSYKISKALTNPGNIYGLDNEDANSHLMKNSEWGAVAYLTQSVYGQNGTEIAINNITLNSGNRARTETAGKSGVDSVYAVTGCTTGLTEEVGKITTISEINSLTGNANANGVYVWNQLSGQTASTTGTIYGIYDISGGTWERTASYIANGNDNLKKYGTSIAYENDNLKTTSTKYTMVYPYKTPELSDVNTASQNNFNINTKIYGDAIRETTSSNAGTSNDGWNKSSWNSDYSRFAALSDPFFVRGGHYWDSSVAGTFTFSRNYGVSHYSFGFRAVLVPINDKSPIEPVIVEGPRAGGNYDNPYIPSGFTHTEGNGTWNSGYTIRETSTGNEFVWVPCVTDESKIKSGDNVTIYEKILPSATSSSDSNYMYNKHNFTITGDESPADLIKLSVEKYGGFYIAKYEAGVPVDENKNEIVSTSAVVTQKARSVYGATTWTDISRKNAIKAAENMINTTDGVKSGLITGEAWDTTLQWMVNTSDDAEKNADYDINSTGKGYYGQSSKTTTGKYSENKVNNIYDMAGNVWEWTTENCTLNSNSYIVNRGGSFFTSGLEAPAAHRGNSNGSSHSNISFRVVLYKQVIPYDKPYIPTGFTHTTGTWNNGYTIKETSTGNEFVWVPCVTDQKYVKQGDKVETFGRTLPSTTSATDPNYMYNRYNLAITGEESLADTIKSSVEKYGGFYIAKYEAGVPVDSNNNEIEPTSATVTQKARSVAGAKVWTDITRTNAITAASNMIYTNDGVKSALISGEAWDTTLKWMVNTSDNATENRGYDINSTGNGWYEKNDKTVTGQYPINNIYDMAGNLIEWTTENCIRDGSNYLVARGGYYSVFGIDFPAAHRSNQNDFASDRIAFRVVLYK